MSLPSDQDRLEAVLAEARHRSLIGNMPFAAQKAHSEEFLRALLMEAVNGPVLELGSGGGLPGLVLAVQVRDFRLVLLDSSHRSADFLRWAVEELGLSSPRRGRQCPSRRARTREEIPRMFCSGRCPELWPARSDGRVCGAIPSGRRPAHSLRAAHARRSQVR